MKPDGEQFVESRSIGLKGLNTFTDPSALTDADMPDCRNIIFDSGVIQPRPGSVLYAKKPVGETGNALQIIPARDSQGNWYLLASYDSNNIYMWNGFFWIKITQTYSFTNASWCAYQGWNFGKSQDVLFLSNGVDVAGRIRLFSGTLASTANTSDAKLTLTDASNFYSEAHIATGVSGNTITVGGQTVGNPYTSVYTPLGTALYYTASGTPIGNLTANTVYYAIPSGTTNPTSSNSQFSLATSVANAKAGTAITLSGSLPGGTHTFYYVAQIVVSDGTNTATAIYYSISGNVLSLIAQIGTLFGPGATVVSQLEQRPGIPLGSVMTSWTNSLTIANGKGSENTLQVSCAGVPEDFTVGAEIAFGDMQACYDGDPQIVGVHNFGLFLVVEKNNNMYRFSYNFDSTLNTKQGQLTPIIAGQGVGPVSKTVPVQTMGTLYYPSLSTGIMSLAPVSTGYTTTTQFAVISMPITNLVLNSLTFANDSRGTFVGQKLFWTTGFTGEKNSLILMYDLIRQAWSLWDSWAPKDIISYQYGLFYISATDGNVYQGLMGYNDAGNPYTSYAFTKRYNFGPASMPKTADALYIEGYLASATNLYVDVLYNERGGQLKKTYKINRSNINVLFTPLSEEALSQISLYGSALSDIENKHVGTLGSFRCYLSIPNGLAFFSIQVQVYSLDANAVWGLIGIAVNPKQEPIVPATLRLDSIDANNPIESGQSSNQNQVIPMASFQIPASGVVNGINQTFVWLRAPSVIVIDGVPLQQENQDGTVNWTGSTTTIFQNVAPLSSIFAL